MLTVTIYLFCGGQNYTTESAVRCNLWKYYVCASVTCLRSNNHKIICSSLFSINILFKLFTRTRLNVSQLMIKIKCFQYLLIGWRHGFVMNISWKYGLQMASTILCACNNFPSQANVTSTKSPRSNKFWKPEAILS